MRRAGAATPAPAVRPRRVAAAAVVALAAAGVLYLLVRPARAPGSGSGLAVGSRAPDFTATTLDGRTVTLRELPARLVLLNFWGSWCPPCREEMPYFDEAYRRYRDRGLVVLGINLGESEVAVKAFLERVGVSFPVVIDRRGQLARLYDVVPLPTTYVIDAEGRIRARVAGVVPRQQLAAWVAQYLEADRP